MHRERCQSNCTRTSCTGFIKVVLQRAKRKRAAFSCTTAQLGLLPFLICRILGNNRSRNMNGLFKVKHPPARNSTGLLGSTSSWALECYCIWKDETERLSDKHERGVQHRETTAVQRMLFFHKHQLWNLLKTMADNKHLGEYSVSCPIAAQLFLYSCPEQCL